MWSRVFSPAALIFLVSAVTLSAQPFTRIAARSLSGMSSPPATERVFSSMSFSAPVSLVTPPGETRRLFIVEKPGRIWVIPDVTAAEPTRTLFLDISARVTVLNNDPADERGLLALAFHPNYATNGQFYVWYTPTATTGGGTGLHNRLARFRVSTGDPNVADPTSEEPLISQFDEIRNHNGGQLLFGPDGYLYLSIGDEGGSNDQFQNSQRIDRDFFSSILRLDVDRRPGSLLPNPHPAVHAGTYAIPPDNPFVSATTFNGAAVNPTAVRTEFWAVGLRNPWRMSFDPATGQLWCADVGQAVLEEINIITRGGNYGWNFREGTRPFRGTPPAAATFTNPVWEYSHSVGQAITGGMVYRGNRSPRLYGQYLFADFVSGAIWALQPDGTQPVAANRIQLLTTDPGISSFGLNPANGDILLTDLQEGTIKRLTADFVTNNAGYPALLSETGVFSNTASLTPAAGFVPYEPNVSFWSDHARKRRWFALPDTTSTYGFSAHGNWTLPTGALWVKHFDLELRRGDPSSARRVETRLLVKTANGVFGLTYRWNDAQTEATLVSEDGADQSFSVTENGVARTQIWHFPSRGECLVCHTERCGYALSFNTRQLNRDFAFPGGSANIVTALAQAGYLNTSAPPAPTALPALTNPSDLSQPLELRARSYLDANCAQCHQPGGTAPSSWDARARTPLSLAGIVNGALIANGGDAAQRVIVPGDAAHSQLLARLAGQGVPRMPPVATNERDLAAEALLSQWIGALAQPLPTSRLINLSTRAQALTGSATLIPGFTIADGDKTLLIRAAGPALSGFGVGDALSNPTLTLFRGSEPIATNTRWNTAPNATEIRAAATRAGAFAFPEASADSALLATLPPGGYTAQITSANGATGVALLELYDTNPSPPTSGSSVPSRLTNTSVRAQVGVGAQILIPGLTVSAGTAKTVLIRAIGPGLAAFNVSNPLAQPVLTLFAGDEAFHTNTRWNTAINATEIRAAAARVGAFALSEGSADSALLVTLSPGAYTLQISGANSTTGVALVELYEIP